MQTPRWVRAFGFAALALMVSVSTANATYGDPAQFDRGPGSLQNGYDRVQSLCCSLSPSDRQEYKDRMRGSRDSRRGPRVLQQRGRDSHDIGHGLSGADGRERDNGIR